MRLIHALIDIDHDDLKAKFLNRLNLPAGQLVALLLKTYSNSSIAQPMYDTYLQLAEKWNDSHFEPETVAFTALHTELFSFFDVILYIEVADLTSSTPATAEKVEDKWAWMFLEMNC